MLCYVAYLMFGDDVLGQHLLFSSVARSRFQLRTYDYLYHHCRQKLNFLTSWKSCKDLKNTNAVPNEKWFFVNSKFQVPFKLFRNDDGVTDDRRRSANVRANSELTHVAPACVYISCLRDYGNGGTIQKKLVSRNFISQIARSN